MTIPISHLPVSAPESIISHDFDDRELFDECVEALFDSCNDTPLQPSPYCKVTEVIAGRRFLTLANRDRAVAAYFVPERGPVVEVDMDELAEARADAKSLK